MQDTPDSSVPDPSVVEWVAEWGAEVAAADIRAARGRFDDGLVAFGTYADVVVGRDAVEAGQWLQIWPAAQRSRCSCSRSLPRLPWCSCGSPAVRR